MRGSAWLCGTAFLLSAVAGQAQSRDRPAVEGDAFAARFSFVGQVRPRHARDVAASPWSVGGEAVDRDYSTYRAWAAHLGPLGVKRIRLQSGWSRTDQGGGRYDFGWLDPVIDGVRADGVEPWLSLSYGNPRYPGGGTLRRDTPLPTGEGLAAWTAYVRATVGRYRGRVREFEIWNEPNINAAITPDGYARFARETERAVRAANPEARIIFGAFAGAPWPGGRVDARNPETHAKSVDFAEAALKGYYRLGGRAEVVTYHGYTVNPDAIYPDVDRFVAGVRRIDGRIEVRQGENGAPSLNQPTYAFRNLWWTEQSQAKWMLRRMLGDAARGIPSSVFTLTEMHYPVAAETGLNFVGGVDRRLRATSAKHMKGLVETKLYAPGSPEDDRTVVRTKMIYPAVQAVTAVFDASLAPVGPCGVSGASGPVAAHLFRRRDGAAVVAAWRTGDVPDANTAHEAVDLTCPGATFRAAPHYVDLLTRAVYATDGVVESRDGAIVATGVPIYDSPVLLAEAALVQAR